MKTKINIGVIGCANIAVRSVIPSILELKNFFNLVGIASRRRGKANFFASKFNSKPFFSYESLIEDKSLDAVYIPLPNSLHYHWVNEALDAGLHVLVEKSLACTEKEVTTLNRKASKKGLALIENFQFRFHKQLYEIQNIIENGSLGELRNMRSFFGFPPFLDMNNIRYQEGLGGGALLDVGAYPIKISQILLGLELEVKAATVTYDKAYGVDIWGGGFLKQKKGNLFSEIAFGFDNFYQCNVEIWGSEGKLYTNRIFTAPSNYESTLYIETKSGNESKKIEKNNHFNNMLLHFYKVINNIDIAQDEYNQNINQARLIEEFKIKSNER